MNARALIAASSLFLVFGAAGAEASDSAYTDLDIDKCQKLSEYEAGASFKCPGYGNYPVYLSEGDLRESVFFGPIADDLIENGFESFAQFNYVNNKIEWRLDASGTPFAAILRWFIENPDENGVPTKETTGQVLVVSRVAQADDGIGCVVGYVDAGSNPDANELARQLADTEALSFACGYNESFWHGERGTKAGDPTHSLPERLAVE